MNITKIEKQKKYNRYNIYIDESYSFSASDEDIIKYSLKEGTSLNEHMLDDIINSCEYSKAYNYSLNLIGLQDYLSNEIKKKLKKNGFSDQTVEKVISNLKKYNFINDDEYVKKYLNEHIKFKKEGIKKILYDLKNKGADTSIIDKYDYSDVLLENALYMANKKYASIKGGKNVENKIYRYLEYHGYSYDIIKSVMQRLFHMEGSD